MNQASQAATIGLWGGAAAYVLAWLFMLLRRPRTGTILLWVAWVLNAGVFLVNWLLAQAPPFGNMHHVLVVLALCFPILHTVLARRAGLSWTGVYFAFASALTLAGAISVGRDLSWRRMPALQSPWFVPHVFSYMLAYALDAVAFALLVTKWRRLWLGPSAGGQSCTAAAAAVLRLAFPFMTFGMLSGALWAEEAWGAYWSWDPKETWSLITWSLYLVYFHARLSPRFHRWADLGHALAFVALLVTFLLVNLLPRLGSVLHGYA